MTLVSNQIFIFKYFDKINSCLAILKVSLQERYYKIVKWKISWCCKYFVIVSREWNLMIIIGAVVQLYIDWNGDFNIYFYLCYIKLVSQFLLEIEMQYFARLC